MPLSDINQDQGLGIYTSENSTIEYKDSSGVYVPIPGFQEFSFTGATAPTRDVITANTAPQQRSGKSRVGQVSVNSLAMPQDPAWRFLRDAQYSETYVHFRTRMNALEAFNSARGTNQGAKVAISTAGVVTFTAGTSTNPSPEAAPTIAGTPIGRGMLIRPKTVSSNVDALGSTGYLITRITEAGVITAVDISTYAAPTTAVSATLFVLYDPAPLERVFSGAIVQGADTEMGAEAEMTTTLVVAPRVRIADWAVYLP